jgi:hypothetical protein
MRDRCLFCGGDPGDPNHAEHCDGRQGANEARINGMVHRNDPYTSIEAAEVIARKRTELHGRVLEAFDTRGPMTDEELEQLPAFVPYGPSTIRKRRSELYQQGSLEVCGERRNSRDRKMLIWRKTERAEA